MLLLDTKTGWHKLKQSVRTIKDWTVVQIYIWYGEYAVKPRLCQTIVKKLPTDPSQTSVWWIKCTHSILHHLQLQSTHVSILAPSHFQVFIVLLSLDRCRFAEAVSAASVCFTCAPCAVVAVSLRFMIVYRCDFPCILEGRRERESERPTADLLTLLKMTYQITQRTGICPCPWFTYNCFIIQRSQSRLRGF